MAILDLTYVTPDELEDGLKRVREEFPAPPAPIDFSEYATLSYVDQKVSEVPTGGGGAVPQFGLWLDSFEGTDDEKLDKAMAQVNADTVKRPILLANRKHSLSKSRTIGSGFKLINPYGFGNQQRGANSIPCHVNFTGSGSMFQIADAQTFDIEFRGIGFTATGTSASNKTTFLSTGPSRVIWTSLFRDLGFLNWYGVFGNQEQKFLNTACAWDGWLNINNARGTSLHLGGSDSLLNWSTALIDAGSKQMDPNAFHIIFSSQQKTPVSGIYMTADNVKGIRISGSASNGHLTLSRNRIEGRNAGAPSNQLIQIDSGRVKFIDNWIGFQRSGSHIENLGGELVLIGNDFGKADSWAVGKVTSRPVLEAVGNTSNWGVRPTFA